MLSAAGRGESLIFLPFDFAVVFLRVCSFPPPPLGLPPVPMIPPRGSQPSCNFVLRRYISHPVLSTPSNLVRVQLQCGQTQELVRF